MKFIIVRDDLTAAQFYRRSDDPNDDDWLVWCVTWHSNASRHLVTKFFHEQEALRFLQIAREGESRSRISMVAFKEPFLL